MSGDTRIRFRAMMHGIRLFWAGIKADRNLISEYIEIQGNPNDLHIEHNGSLYEGKVIYLIDAVGEGYGFFAEIKTLLENLMFADQYGFIPCVRFGTKFTYYDESYDETTNAFEYYFMPIGENIFPEKACNLLHSKAEYGQSLDVVYNPNPDGSHLSEEFANRLAHMIDKYIHIKPSILEDFNFEFDRIRSGNQKIVGVHYRGGDYKCNYNQHPKSISISETDSLLEECFYEKNYDVAFLATDDVEAYEYFKGKYGDRIHSFDDVIRTNEETSVAFSSSNRDKHKYKLGLEVLRDMYLLSRCDGLICGLSQVTNVARLFKKARGEEYMYIQVIDKGINRNLKKFKISGKV